MKFVWNNIVYRCGILYRIISDNGKQFVENSFKSWCKELEIKQSFTSVVHPQANGQVEVTNRTIVLGLKTKLDQAKGEWIQYLPHILWSYQTIPWAAISETSYSLAYESEVVIPTDIGVTNVRIVTFNEGTNEEELKTNLDLLEEKSG